MKRIIVATSVAALISVAVPAAAQAADRDTPRGDKAPLSGVVGNSTGGGFVPGNTARYTVAERADMNAKSDLEDAYAKYSAGKMSDQDYEEIEDRVERELGIALPRSPTCPGRRGCPVDTTSELLKTKHRTQRTSYYCGNTVGAIIAGFKGKRRSEFNRKRLSQRNMGGASHMRTVQNEVTRYDSNLFTRGLNRWVYGKSRGFYGQKNSPGVRRVKKSLRYDIDHRIPLGLSTVEFENGKHYNGHYENLTIGHWLVARGYARKGRVIRMQDPVAGRWPGVKKSFKKPTRYFTKAFLQSNGISS